MTLALPQLGSALRPVWTTPTVDLLLSRNSPVAIGVSGGKDSSAVAIATCEHLDEIGHGGPRVLIHSDLGRVEWQQSGEICQRLADRLGVELITVRRQAGGMMERWLTRWDNNVARYVNLECVKLILPWSTASMRFCTSELKTAIICRELIKRFPGSQILSASGIRRQESPGRSKAPVLKVQPKLTSGKHRTGGYDWNPIIDWTLGDVLAFLRERRFALHEAYTTYGSSRVSCAFCILGSRGDLKASASCEDNADIYREMVDLEIRSTFSFQDKQWLGDVAPHLLTDENKGKLLTSKALASQRQAAERQIPDHLLYTAGWPTCIPTHSEARLLCDVRRVVSDAVGFSIKYIDPDALIARYEELMAAKEAA